MGIDAWGWDAPLHMQAQQAKERDERRASSGPRTRRASPTRQIERLANLGALPATGFPWPASRCKVVGGSAGPARVVAILDD